MRIVTLTAGTGSFHCGTCMRDNALTVALRELGHVATLAPLYLPMILDEDQAAGDSPLFYGGVNVYLQQKSALFRKTPRWLDSLLDSPALLKTAAKRAGMTQASELGELTLSMIMGEEGKQLKELDRLADWLAEEGKPDVVCLSNALLLGVAPRIKERTGAVVVCTLQGEDGFLDSLPQPFREQVWSKLGEIGTRDVDAFIGVSRYHADLMASRAGLPANKVHVIHNAILLDGYPTTPRMHFPNPPVLGYLARMHPMKGLGALVDSFIAIRLRGAVPNLKLMVAGSQTESDGTYVANLQEKIKAAGLESDVEFHPNVSREQKIDFLKGLSVLSVPAMYGESFGLYVIEAMAAGTPVVQPRHAGFTEIVEASGGGLLYDPESENGLEKALVTLLNDPQQALELGEAGRQAVARQFNIEHMARETASLFEDVCSNKQGAASAA